jgi:hydroxymethylbilane synthase
VFLSETADARAIKPMTKTLLTIGSRGSALALWQARHVAARLGEFGVETRIEIIKTTGDHLQTASLALAGGKGLFTKEIEDALLAGLVDLAVHSLKDLPADLPAGLALAAVPEREDPRDALVGRTLAELEQGALVGTSSGRRAAQLRLMRPDLLVAPIRGNVDTRLRKVREGEYAASLLAVAGLRRLGLEDQIAQIFSVDEMTPAPGQGALGIETREQGEAWAICRRLENLASRRQVTCERAVLAELGGGCQLPLGALAEREGPVLRARAVIIAPHSGRFVRAVHWGAPEDAERIGRELARMLLSAGGGAILEEVAAAASAGNGA